MGFPPLGSSTASLLSWASTGSGHTIKPSKTPALLRVRGGGLWGRDRGEPTPPHTCHSCTRLGLPSRPRRTGSQCLGRLHIQASPHSGPRSRGLTLAGTKELGHQDHPQGDGLGHLNMAMSRFMSSTLVTSRKVTSRRMTSQLA